MHHLELPSGHPAKVDRLQKPFWAGLGLLGLQPDPQKVVRPPWAPTPTTSAASRSSRRVTTPPKEARPAAELRGKRKRLVSAVFSNTVTTGWGVKRKTHAFHGPFLHEDDATLIRLAVCPGLYGDLGTRAWQTIHHAMGCQRVVVGVNVSFGRRKSTTKSFRCRKPRTKRACPSPQEKRREEEERCRLRCQGYQMTDLKCIRKTRCQMHARWLDYNLSSIMVPRVGH